MPSLTTGLKYQFTNKKQEHPRPAERSVMLIFSRERRQIMAAAKGRGNIYDSEGAAKRRKILSPLHG